MAKLAAVVEKLEEVAEPFRGAYVEQDGKYVLDTDVDTHPQVAGLKSALNKERDASKLTAKELKAFKDSGLTLDEIAEVKKQREAGTGGDGGKPDIEKLIAKRVAEMEARFKPDLDERDKLRAENRKLKLTDNVRAAFLKAGGCEEDADDAVRLTERHFDLDDKGRPVVLDEDGDPSGKTPEQWFAEVYKKQKPKLFKGTGASGSGARSSDGGSGAGEAELRKLPGARMVEAAFAGGHTKAK